ncbi:hypothetical protein [Proteiniphilum acetatigenes]|uniref:hypothetical protein n=1 Tax=Proteiniphilum acetatigenes TaxID=294710 RepID=UPI00035E0CEF|nr:hypothetical protein [Proteiniphilum acetatigenes]SFK48127.1 hypothetical protein SAMN05216357_102334 [Porphyromonadaceae bacterium KH3CP3RA]
MNSSGIKIKKDQKGRTRYVKIDMKKHGNNELLEDFLDIEEANSRQGGETISLQEFKENMDKRFGKCIPL